MYYLLLLIYIGSQVHMYEVSEHCECAICAKCRLPYTMANTPHWAH
jgi:hypothetical protein